MSIVRKGAPEALGEFPERAHLGPWTEERYSEAGGGGITQFGAHVVTLPPGSRSSDRHWHSDQDEFLYVLSGEATVIEEDGPHLLGPGDAAVWPAGAANGHTVENNSDAPCSFLIVGGRTERDRIVYPDRDRTLCQDGLAWRLVQTSTGQVLREGEDL